jgi:hypothetical protein
MSQSKEINDAVTLQCTAVMLTDSVYSRCPVAIEPGCIFCPAHEAENREANALVDRLIKEASGVAPVVQPKLNL